MVKKEEGADPASVVFEAIQKTKQSEADVLIVDTAGRLHIDEQLMQELQNVKQNVKPHEILLVVDSMTGQDAVNVGQTFNEKLGIDGVILTKLDGDTRGGAAISVKKITGRPIKFAATGEKLSDIEVFHPESAGREILPEDPHRRVRPQRRHGGGEEGCGRRHLPGRGQRGSDYRGADCGSYWSRY